MNSKNLLALLALSLTSTTGAWAATCTGTASVQSYMPYEDQISEGVTPETTQTQVSASRQLPGRRSEGKIEVQAPIQGLDTSGIRVTYSFDRDSNAATQQAFFWSIPQSRSENAHYLGEGTVRDLGNNRVRIRGTLLRQGLRDFVRPETDDFEAYQTLNIELSCS